MPSRSAPPDRPDACTQSPDPPRWTRLAVGPIGGGVARRRAKFFVVFVQVNVARMRIKDEGVHWSRGRRWRDWRPGGSSWLERP